ncbi:DUF4347 domain-containing protein, partial [Dolichospermum sp. LEGE 00246]|uniref:DUF4347 domain-containing protein n=1 Tax=Dolichospermum sp. LEGE 00246 TaxID=1828605 RepID=UPI001881942D|nr:DUF4347 domain-containing protein [Dolichospermum sp. LEGE 00246]
MQIAIRDTEERLQQFAQRPDFREKMILAFGTSPEGLQGAWANGVRNVGFKAKEDSGIVVFIDPSVSDYQTLQAGVAEGVEAIALNPNQDGIKQITAVLRQHPEITTIHIVSHGAPGCLYLGNSQLNLDSISKYADLLQHWQSNSILLYGCNVAAGDAGEEFIRKLHQITKASIRASATKTGNAALGGNWELEVSFPVTDGKKSVAFHPEVLAAYSGILALELINLGNGGSNPNYLTNVNGIVVKEVQQYLRKFATNPGFIDKMRLAFGESFEVETALSLAQAWQNQDFNVIPTIEFLSSAQLNGANGAYAVSTNRIYLSEAFLSAIANGSEAISIEPLVGLLLEEIGHKVDSLLNSADSQGDEGAIFSALVQRESLSDAELGQLKAEDDRGFISLNGNVLAVEMQNFTGGNEDNNFVGTSGDNNFSPGTGADSIIGGNGNDFLDIDNRNDTADTTIIYTNVNNGSITGGSNNGTVFQGIERTRLITGSGNDNINVSATDYNGYWQNEIYAGAGNDTVIGSATGYNQLYGEAGDDSLQGGDTNQDHLYGGTGNDALSGLGGNDNLYGEAGNDTLDGGAGDDGFSENAEADVIIGGAGTDSLTLYGLATGTTVNYSDPNNGTTSAGGTITGIENFYYRGNNTTGNDNVNASG